MQRPLLSGFAFLLCAAAAATACSDASETPEPEPPVDAGPAPTPVTCPERVPPATDPYVIRAFAFDSNRETPFPGAEIEVRNRSDDAVLLKASANGQGQVDLSVPTGKKLLDIYVRAVAPPGVSDHVPTRVEIQGGHIGLAVQLVVYSTAALQERAALAGVTWDPTRAVVQVGINRCNDGTAPTPPIEAAKITVSPGSTTSYAVGRDVFDPKLRLTTTYGGATDFGVTPGAITIVTVKDARSNTYATKAEAGMNLFALFQP